MVALSIDMHKKLSATQIAQQCVKLMDLQSKALQVLVAALNEKVSGTEPSETQCIFLTPIDTFLIAPPNTNPITKGHYSRLVGCLKNGKQKRGHVLCGPVPIEFVFQCLVWTEPELMKINGMGIHIIELLKEALKKHNLQIGMFAHLRLFLNPQTT
jgi:hypothetical protein